VRLFSSRLKAALTAQESGEVLVMLLTFSHPALPTPIRVSSDSQNTVSGGVTYLPFPFQIGMPDDSADQMPQAQITIDAIDRSFITALRLIPDAPTITMVFVLASQPDTIEASWTFMMRDVAYDAFSITGVLSYEQVLDEPYPGDQVTPSTMPAVFQ
jgi:hypothetical protein